MLGKRVVCLPLESTVFNNENNAALHEHKNEMSVNIRIVRKSLQILNTKSINFTEKL